MVAEIAALDLWTLFVQYVFGGFWMAILGLSLVMFIILGVLGRVSIWTTTWYILMFITAMTLGFGYVLINVIMWVILSLAMYFSIKSYIDSK